MKESERKEETTTEKNNVEMKMKFYYELSHTSRPTTTQLRHMFRNNSNEESREKKMKEILNTL